MPYSWGRFMKLLISLPTSPVLVALCLVLAGCSAEQRQEQANATPYPLDTCIVSDEKLGADSDMVPYTFVHEGQEIKLCCKNCLKSFNEEPQKYLAKLHPPAAPPQPQ